MSWAQMLRMQQHDGGNCDMQVVFSTLCLRKKHGVELFAITS